MGGAWHARIRIVPGRPTAARYALAAALVCGVAVMPAAPASAAPGAGNAGARPSGARHAGAGRAETGHALSGNAGAAAGSSAFDWPEFHRSTTLGGYARNSSLSTANASKLGVAWAADLYGPALDSPVVAYDAALNKRLAYIGTERGDMIAVNVANGSIVWSTWLGSPIRTTPVVSGGSVYAGTANSARVYKLNASTGTVECSAGSPQPIEGTPVIATPPGGVRTLYVGTNDSLSAPGPLLAIAAGNCQRRWSFTGYQQRSGSWDAVSYAVDARHRPLVLFGSADPDTAVYAVNAVTGKRVWRFAAANPPPHTFDIGTGVTVSPPAPRDPDGTAYVASKLGIMYALDLTTGHLIWQYNFNKALGAHEGGRSTAALDGTNLVFGYNGGLVNLDAVTGARTWAYRDPAGAEALSSPAIAGPPGGQIVAVGDLGGGVDVVSLATGAQLYHYQTGGYITASPAVSGGNLLIASSDGFLYDFAAGGGNDPSLPSTVIQSPADNSSLPNPNGTLTVTGVASDPATIAGVVVAVQAAGVDGPWWDAPAHRWVSGPVGNAATVASPGATSSWRFAYPVPGAGGTYQVTAYGVSATGQSGIATASVRFAVRATTSGPRIAARPGFVAPGGTLRVSGAGFAGSERVAIMLAGKTLATATASSGRISTRVTIPKGAPFGQTSLTAKGSESGRTASTAITITNNWDQVGFGHGHRSFEPNDLILRNLVHPGQNIFLDPAWRYQSGAPVNTAPAVADSVAYIANSAGQLSAVDVRNGAPLWTWKLPSGMAMDGSPAVDPAKGLVFAGASDGTLNAIRTTTGQLAWTAQVGGNVSAPVFGGGTVYVTSSSGRVEALSEAAGRKRWSAVLPSAISAAPSLAGQTLVVGESNGAVVALDVGSGRTMWTFRSGGAVSAPATIAGSTVYFGSADGSVYALNAGNGAKRWSLRTGGPVRDTPAISNQGTPGGVLELLVGSGDGNLYALRAANGSRIFLVPFQHPITGVAAVNGVVIIDTSSGLIGASRTYSPLHLWGFQTNAGITSPPAIVDGAVYVGAGDGTLYTFTAYGQLPVAARPRMSWGPQR